MSFSPSSSSSVDFSTLQLVQIGVDVNGSPIFGIANRQNQKPKEEETTDVPKANPVTTQAAAPNGEGESESADLIVSSAPASDQRSEEGMTTSPPLHHRTSSLSKRPARMAPAVPTQHERTASYAATVATPNQYEFVQAHPNQQSNQQAEPQAQPQQPQSFRQSGAPGQVEYTGYSSPSTVPPMYVNPSPSNGAVDNGVQPGSAYSVQYPMQTSNAGAPQQMHYTGVPVAVVQTSDYWNVKLHSIASNPWFGIFQRWAEVILLIVIAALLGTACAQSWVKFHDFEVGIYKMCFKSVCTTMSNADLKACSVGSDFVRIAPDVKAFCDGMQVAQITLPMSLCVTILMIAVMGTIALSCNCCGCFGSRGGTSCCAVVGTIMIALAFALAILSWKRGSEAMDPLLKLPGFKKTAGFDSAQSAWIIGLIAVLINIALLVIKSKTGQFQTANNVNVNVAMVNLQTVPAPAHQSAVVFDPNTGKYYRAV